MVRNFTRRARNQRRRVTARKAAARVVRRRPRGSPMQPVHYFKRQLYISADLITTGGVSLNFAKAFSLQQVPGVAEFTTLYDQYRIMGINCRWMPRGNTQDVIQNHIGSMFTVLDYDDNAPIGITDLVQYQNLKTTKMTQWHSRFVKPRFNVSAGLAGNLPYRGWLDVADTSIEHYGIKGHLQGVSNQTITMDCLVTFYLAFKNVR